MGDNGRGRRTRSFGHVLGAYENRAEILPEISSVQFIYTNTIPPEPHVERQNPGFMM